MKESRNAVPIKPRSPSTHRRALLTSVGLSVAILLGGAFAYRQMSLPDWNSEAHNLIAARPVQAPPIPAVTVHAAERAASPVGFADLVIKVKPAVVSVSVKIDESRPATSMSPKGNLPFQRKRQVVTGQGSGFFISADGYAVTNNHVVEGAQSVLVTTDDGKSYTAKIIGTDPKTDLALIKVDAQDFPYVSFADQVSRVGDWVVAIGNPFGLGGTVTAGIVSAEGRDIDSGPYDYIQIDAPINKGNSGGPAFDMNGNVVGVNTAIYSPSGGSVGIGFDIPAAIAKSVIAQLKADGHVVRGWIGVRTQPVTADVADSLGMKKAQGALVDEARPESPAVQAGIRTGDVITAVNGEVIKDSRELVRKIDGIAPGTLITLTVLRNGEPTTLNLTLGTPPSERQAQAETKASNTPASGTPDLGLALTPAASLAGGSMQGVMVVAVDPSGAGAEHGLQAGDVILSVGGQAVSNPEDVDNRVAQLRKEGKRTVLMQVKSGESTKFVALPLGTS